MIPKKIMIVSHERSGTHFLMNTIANNFGYQSHPWIDLDNTNWLPYVPGNLYKELSLIYKHEPSNKAIVKSHHNAEFFNGIIEKLSSMYYMFYIYRNAEDTLKSYWKHLKDIKDKQGWSGGTYTDTYEDFVNAEPYGACMRYQYRQYKTMKERHEDHVNSWLGLKDVILIRYEDLNEYFEDTVGLISSALGEALFHGAPIRPSRANTIQDGIFSGAVLK